MTDYTCPKCGCGFPKHHGKERIRVRHPFGNPKAADSRLHAWLLKLNNAFYAPLISRYRIVCPDCEHTIGGG